MFPILILSNEKKNRKHSTDFQDWIITLKIRILQSLGRLSIILVGVTMTWYSEKRLSSTRCICGIMSNSYKKSWTVSNLLTAESSAPFKNHATYKIKYLSINKRTKIKKTRFLWFLWIQSKIGQIEFMLKKN